MFDGGAAPDLAVLLLDLRRAPFGDEGPQFAAGSSAREAKRGISPEAERKRPCLLLHRKPHQVRVHEETQQEVVNVLQLLRSSHVQHQDPRLGFPAGKDQPS